MLPTQVVRLEAERVEWFPGWPRASWSVLRPHPGLQIRGQTMPAGAKLAFFCRCGRLQPGDEGQREEVSLTIRVKTDKFAKEIKPVSLERAILTNVNVHLDNFFFFN